MYEIIQCNSKNKHGSKLERAVDNYPPVSIVRMGVVIANIGPSATLPVSNPCE